MSCSDKHTETITINAEDLDKHPVTIPAEVAEEHLINWDHCPMDWTCSGYEGNFFRAAFAINLVLWSLGIFEGWSE